MNLLELIIDAAYNGASTKTLSRMIKRCKTINDLDDAEGWALIHMAVSFDRSTLLRLLLAEPSVQVDLKSRCGETALGFAFKRDDFSKALMLLRAGANVANINTDESVLHLYMSTDFDKDNLRLMALYVCHLYQFQFSNVVWSRELARVIQRYDNLPSASTAFRLLLLMGASLNSEDRDLLAQHSADTLTNIQHCLAFSEHELQTTFATEYSMLNKMRYTVIMPRATEICLALQSLKMDANRMCEIVMAACEPLARDLPFCLIWNLVTKVKHFHDGKKED